MITEDYVSFETAKLLKEKGFDSDDCIAFYKKTGEIGFLQAFGDLLDCDESGCIIAPTLQMAMKWLREQHCVIVPIPSIYHASGRVAEWTCSIWADDNLEIDGEDPYSYSYNSYEEACEGAIKYCLTEII